MAGIDYLKIFEKMPWEKIMNSARENGKLSHAYIMFSKDSELCFEFFLHQAKLLQGGCGGCGECRSCLSIEARTSPDFFVFPVEKYSVEDSEKILEECFLKPFEFATKIFLLKDFDEASSAVQNKLLKVIEEPPKNVYFFITAKIFDRVLPTIRSRAVKFFLKDFEADEIESSLEGVFENPEAGIFQDKSKVKLASILAMGKISKAVSLYESAETKEMAVDAITLLARLKTSKDLLSCKVITDKYEDNAEEFLYLLQIVYRDLLMHKSGLDGLVFFAGQSGLYQKIENEFSIDALLKIADVISEKVEEILIGASKMGVLDTALLKIVEVKNIWR